MVKCGARQAARGKKIIFTPDFIPHSIILFKKKYMKKDIQCLSMVSVSGC
jgi:hypothetical protein